MLEQDLEVTRQEIIENMDYIYLGHNDSVLKDLEWAGDRYGEVLRYKSRC